MKTTQQSSDVVATAAALFFSSWVHQLCGDAAEASELTEVTFDYAGEQNLIRFQTWGSIMKGWATIEIGQRLEEGVRQIAFGVIEDESHGGFLTPFFRSLLAQGHARCGHTEEALALLDRSLGQTNHSRACLWEAELHRLRGMILLSRCSQNAPNAKVCFDKAIKVARTQSAKALV